MFRSYTEKVYRPNLKSQSSSAPPTQWFACDICADDEEVENHWRTETDIELHRKEVHGKVIFEQMRFYRDRFCTVCMTLHANRDDLLSHIKSRHLYSSPTAQRVEREIFICEHCLNIFFNRDVLEVHMQYLHLGAVKYKRKCKFICPKCEKTCRLQSLWFHMQNHEIPSVSVCDICLLQCNSVKNLEAHVKTHPQYFKCDICDYQTSKKSVFLSHLTRHKIDNNVNLKKSLYKDIFHTLPATQMPMKFNIHHAIKGLTLPVNIHICILCREICTNKDEMIQHASRAHGPCVPAPSPVSFRCVCGAHFPSRVLLKHHAFKLKGEHRESQTINETAEQQMVVLNQNLTNTDSKTEVTEWQVGFEVEVHQNQSSQDDDVMVTSTEHGVEEIAGDDDDQLVYIYAAIDEDELVSMEEDNDQIIGF